MGRRKGKEEKVDTGENGCAADPLTCAQPGPAPCGPLCVCVCVCVCVLLYCRPVHGELCATWKRSTLRTRQAERRSRAWQSVPSTSGTTGRWRQPSASLRRRTV